MAICIHNLLKKQLDKLILIKNDENLLGFTT